jgi:hypothetical protein
MADADSARNADFRLVWATTGDERAHVNA